MSSVMDLPLELADNLGQSFRVREFAATDRAALTRMYHGFEPKRVAQGLPPATDHAIDRWLDHALKGGIHLLVEIDGRIAGHVMLIPRDDPKSVELANFLHQSVRGRGVGTAMNRLAIAMAQLHGYERVWLSVEPSNTAAIRSYQRAGLEIVKRTMFAHEIEMEIRI